MSRQPDIRKILLEVENLKRDHVLRARQPGAFVLDQNQQVLSLSSVGRHLRSDVAHPGG